MNEFRNLFLNYIDFLIRFLTIKKKLDLQTYYNKFVTDLCLNSIELGLNLEKLFLRSITIKIHEVSQFNFKKHFQE